MSKEIELFNEKFDLSQGLLEEYHILFEEHGIPFSFCEGTPSRAERILMASTHGYWGDPPPAGVPDTGGQTYYVLKVSKAWAKKGRQVIILARWFEPYPRVERFAENLWLVRLRAGGDQFVLKEEIYPLVPELAEGAVAVAALFGAQAAVGHYADGMAVALEVGERLGIPVVAVPHSLGVRKAASLGYDLYDPETWFDERYNFWIREAFELASLRGANLEIANAPQEPEALKEYYGVEFPHLVMPPGAGEEFFEAESLPYRELLARYGLRSKGYLIYFGRFSEAKNVPGVVKVFGEMKRMAPEVLEGVKLVLVGGSLREPSDEERRVEEGIEEEMERYRLREEVLRLPSQPWSALAVLAHHSLFFIGTQRLEPFGMGAAEAMAAGTPVAISQVAGIVRWIRDGEEALVIDPDDPTSAARRILSLLRDREALERLAARGRELVRNNFRWEGIAERQAAILDQLIRGEVPEGLSGDKDPRLLFRRKRRAYHRAAFPWRGDPPMVRSHHKRAAKELLPYILREVDRARSERRRAIVALAGESGAGKTEVAEYLRFLLRREGIWGVTIPGDAFFKLPPPENHRARLEAYTRGRLEEWVGPQEVDLGRLNGVLAEVKRREVKEVFIPSDCRRLGSRRYEGVPMDLRDVDVTLVDLTYGLLLEEATLKVFFSSSYEERIEEIRERNLLRDPEQDFEFVLKVLEIEHEVIQALKERADLLVTEDYRVKEGPAAN